MEPEEHLIDSLLAEKARQPGEHDEIFLTKLDHRIDNEDGIASVAPIGPVAQSPKIISFIPYAAAAGLVIAVSLSLYFSKQPSSEPTLASHQLAPEQANLVTEAKELSSIVGDSASNDRLKDIKADVKAKDHMRAARAAPIVQSLHTDPEKSFGAKKVHPSAAKADAAPMDNFGGGAGAEMAPGKLGKKMIHPSMQQMQAALNSGDPARIVLHIDAKPEQAQSFAKALAALTHGTPALPSGLDAPKKVQLKSAITILQRSLTPDTQQVKLINGTFKLNPFQLANNNNETIAKQLAALNLVPTLLSPTKPGKRMEMMEMRYDKRANAPKGSKGKGKADQNTQLLKKLAIWQSLLSE